MPKLLLRNNDQQSCGGSVFLATNPKPLSGFVPAFLRLIGQPVTGHQFDTNVTGESLLTKLSKTKPNLKSGEPTPVHILLDISYLNDADYVKLRDWMSKNLTAEQLSRVQEAKATL